MKVSLSARQQESEMRTFKNESGLRGLLLAVLLCTLAVPNRSFADDKTADKTKSDPPAKPDPAKAKNDAPALTERERWLLDQVEELKKRVADLEAKSNPNPPAAPDASAAEPSSVNTATSTVAATAPSAAPRVASANSNAISIDHVIAAIGPQAASEKGKPGVATSPTEPFAYADWTWLNGNARNKDAVWDSKYFTPEFRVDTNFIEDYNQPKDHTMGGSTESFRNGEVQLEQLSFGGDLHVGQVRGRILTMFGLFATTTPRNDASFGVGQWDLRGAYKYFSEAYGGYHFNVNHGLNIDAGIFVSYIGLFSYYNFDNWTYQPSYVSSNTPWFFNGVRIQWFPTDKLKIEPWIINGWQSYAKYNGRPGLGGQILWRPKPWLSMVFNNYGMGTDTLGVPGRSRIHTDDSIEVRYYNHPENMGLDKMAFSLTGDLGCEYGGSAPGTIVSCHNNSNGHPKQDFAGWMLYNRWWFHKDLFGITLGGGVLDNPGRYLTLLPPINGADAVSGSPYFPAVPGSVYKAYDGTVTFDWMPSQYVTFRFETGYRHANVPYFSGRQGITPPGFNASFPTNPAAYVCSNGSSSGITSSGSIAADLPSVETACGTPGNPSGVWFPDLRRGQANNTISIMVKF
jgi:hypothetical protein